MYLPWSWLKVALLLLHPTCTKTIQSFSERQTRFLRIPILAVIVWVENKHVLGNDLNFCMLFEKQTEVRQFIFVANDCSLSKEMSWQKTSKISWNWEQQQQQKNKALIFRGQVSHSMTAWQAARKQKPTTEHVGTLQAADRGYAVRCERNRTHLVCYQFPQV